MRVTSGEKALLGVGVLGLVGLGIYLATRPKALPGGSGTPQSWIVWANSPTATAPKVGDKVQLQGPSSEAIVSSISTNPAILSPVSGTPDTYAALSRGTATLTGMYQPTGQLVQIAIPTAVQVTVS
jgi:hypothetical protein